jgi:hypothetical protein
LKKILMKCQISGLTNGLILNHTTQTKGSRDLLRISNQYFSHRNGGDCSLRNSLPSHHVDPKHGHQTPL